MAPREHHASDAKEVDTSQLPVRIFDTSRNKWQHGSQPFVLPRDTPRFRLEFVCFVGDNCEQIDVDISAMLFGAKGNYLGAVGYGNPVSTDGGVVHMHDSVQPEAGKITEDMAFDLSLVHKRVYAVCLVATTCGVHTFGTTRSIHLRVLTSSRLLPELEEREIVKVVVAREGWLERSDSSGSTPTEPNMLVLGDLRRMLSAVAQRGGDEDGARELVGGGAWDLRAPNVVSAVIDKPDDAIPLVQGYLRKWIPSIEVRGQERLVRRVYDIVSLLPLEELDTLRRDWVKGGTVGVTKEIFLGNMLRVLLRAHANMREERQRVEITSLLSDLFDQISGSKSDGGTASEFGLGQATLAWEQFTTFWVEAAMINTHSETVRCWADETLQWRLDAYFELAVRKPTKLISLPLMRLVVGLEERGSFVSLCNGVTGQHHLTLCPSTLQTVATGGLNPQESFLTVLDVECIDAKGLIVISSTDYAISVWHYNHGNEQAVWRFSFHSRSAQIMVSWVPHEGGFLVSAGVDHVVTAWCVDKQLRLAVMQGHRARVTGATYLFQYGQFATCSFDKTVRLWDANRFKPIAELKRRSPLKFVKSHGDLVLCITLDVNAHVMSVTTRRTWCRLVGHRHQIVGAEIVHFVDPRQGGQTRAITGDAAGGFFIWDIGNGQQEKVGCAQVLQTFSILTWRSNLGEITGFERYHRHLWSVDDGDRRSGDGGGGQPPDETDKSMCHIWPDLVVRGAGGTAVVRTHQLIKDARPIHVLAYSDKSMDLIASTGTHLRFWNLQTSDPLRKIASPCPLGITCMTTDKPDPRRLYLGTSEGGIAVVHIVTGQVLFEVKDVHNGAVALLVVCPTTREVASVGIDRRIAVFREKAIGLGLVFAGGIDKAHKTMISACAVSPDAQLIATSSGGEIRLWHKQTLHFQGGICDLDVDVLGLVFLPGTACLLASDSGGDVVLWVAEFGAGGPTQAGAGVALAAKETAAGATGGDATAAAMAVPQILNLRSDGSGATVNRGAQQQSAPAWDAADITAGDRRGRVCVKAEEEARASGYGGARDGVGGDRNSVVGGGHAVSGDGTGVMECGSGKKAEPSKPRAMSTQGDTPTALRGEGATYSLPGLAKVDLERQEEAPALVAPRQFVCTLRPGVLLSSRPTQQQQQQQQQQQSCRGQPKQHSSPVYEVHLHWMFDDADAAAPTADRPSSAGRHRTPGPTGAAATTAAAVPADAIPVAEAGDEPAQEQQSVSTPPAGKGDDSRGEKRLSRPVVIAGSATGWVEVWRADRLVAMAGVDEKVLAANLLRRQQQDDGGAQSRPTRRCRSGLAFRPPSAAEACPGGRPAGVSTSVKALLEILSPVPPFLRWEAHPGSPVSTLCALGKTPLVVTASTDSTLRLFTLADVQVGAQLFKAAETLGEIDMRDIESVRIDRAEMWACPSLTASSVKPAADIEAFRVFSDAIRAEIAEETTGRVEQVARRAPVVRGRPIATHPVTELSPAQSIAQQLITERTIQARQDAPLAPSCATFLTSLGQQDQQTMDDETIDESLSTGAREDRLRATAEVASAKCGNKGDSKTDHGEIKGGAIGGRREVHVAGSHEGAGRGIDSDKLGWLSRKSDIEAIVSAATGSPTKAADLGSEGRRGRRTGPAQGGRRRSVTEAFDVMRAALTSAGAAKNHLGKVIYGNMYSEIKSGAACNTLVMENVARKNPRGDVKIDTDMSPFLQEKLLPTLDDQTKRNGPTTTASRGKRHAPDVLKKRSGQEMQHQSVGSTATTSSAAADPKSGWEAGRAASLEGGGFHRQQQPTRVRHGKDVSNVNPRTRIRPLSPRFRAIYGRKRDETTAIATAGEQHISTMGKARLPSMEPTGAAGVAATGRRGRTGGGGGDGYSRTTRVVTSASLKTLSLKQMSEGQDPSGRGTEDELERLCYLQVHPENALTTSSGHTLIKSASLPLPALEEHWRRMQERFDSAVSAASADEPPKMGNRQQLKSEARSTVGAYIRTKPDRRRPLWMLLGAARESDEDLLGAPNFGTYRRSEVETLGSVFLLFAREGLRITYDQWRKALLNNRSVSILRGLQFGMLDEDNDGEVSLGDMTRAVFRRASDHDQARIRRFLELWLSRERRKLHMSQVRRVIHETRAGTLPESSSQSGAEHSLSQPQKPSIPVEGA